MTVIEYVKNMINEYDSTFDTKKRKSIEDSLWLFMNSLTKHDYYDKRTYKIIQKMYIKFIIKVLDNLDYDSNDDYNYKSKIENDLIYIRGLLKYIDIEDRNNSTDNTYTGTIKELEEYIDCNQKFYNLYKSDKYDLVVDRSLINSNTIELDNKYVIALDYLNINSYIHELMHIYNGYNDGKYSETPSILSELAITKKYNLFNDCDRANDIHDLKRVQNSSFITEDERTSFEYGIAALVAISFIYKNGTNFNDVMKAVDYIIENKDIELYNLFKYLNITDNEIIYSANNIDKVLAYKK